MQRPWFRRRKALRIEARHPLRDEGTASRQRSLEATGQMELSLLTYGSIVSSGARGTKPATIRGAVVAAAESAHRIWLRQSNSARFHARLG
jgi:hypothetical protein